MRLDTEVKGAARSVLCAVDDIMAIDVPLRFTHSAFRLSYTPWSSTSAWLSSPTFSTLTMLLLRSRPTRTVRPGLPDIRGLRVDIVAVRAVLGVGSERWGSASNPGCTQQEGRTEKWCDGRLFLRTGVSSWSPFVALGRGRPHKPTSAHRRAAYALCRRRACHIWVNDVICGLDGLRYVRLCILLPGHRPRVRHFAACSAVLAVRLLLLVYICLRAVVSRSLGEWCCCSGAPLNLPDRVVWLQFGFLRRYAFKASGYSLQTRSRFRNVRTSSGKLLYRESLVVC